MIYNSSASTKNSLWFCSQKLEICGLVTVWTDWAICCTLGNFLKHVATIILPKSPSFLGNFCKGVEIFHFYSEIIFAHILYTFGNFLLVTLFGYHISYVV